MPDGDFEIFCVAPPGLEEVLAGDVRALGFPSPEAVPGGVRFTGGWPDVWRANLSLRGASRVLARIDSFRVVHLSQLDKRARRVDWASVLRPDVAVKVEASCRGSKIYHAGAASERVERAITETLGAPVRDDAPLTVRSASTRMSARSVSTRPASSCTAAASRPRSTRHRCGKPWPRCF